MYRVLVCRKIGKGKVIRDFDLGERQKSITNERSTKNQETDKTITMEIKIIVEIIHKENDKITLEVVNNIKSTIDLLSFVLYYIPLEHEHSLFCGCH